MSHSFKTIHNFPADRNKRFHPWCFWSKAFNDNELQKIIDLMDSSKLTKGKVISGTKAKFSNVRKSNVKFFNFKDGVGLADWIFFRLNAVIEGINNRYYNFDLNGYDHFQYTVYHGKEKGKYDFHMDTTMDQDKTDNDCRKLSMTFLLSEPNKDFKGGEFQINDSEEKNARTIPMNKGDIILFPSFMLHRVKPVTAGVRKSIVVWVLGPKFR